MAKMSSVFALFGIWRQDPRYENIKLRVAIYPARINPARGIGPKIRNLIPLNPNEDGLRV